jgi:PAS domain S-box-containing protein
VTENNLGHFAVNGKMAELVNAKDWSKTSLGSIEQWPQSLKTTVSLCLASNFPINIAWGPDRIQIYNDGYWPICGEKHPKSMGQDYKECWFSAWEVIGEHFEMALLGQTRFLENQRMFLDRYGYLEETFFTFSFSPIRDESGGVGGLFHPVTELTQQTLSERRLNIVRTLADRTADAETVESATKSIVEALREFEFDLPFVALYTLNPTQNVANLASVSGVEPGSTIAPLTVDINIESQNNWPLGAAKKEPKFLKVDKIGERFGEFSCLPYPEAPHSALIFPIYLSSSAEPYAFFIAGVSSRRAFDARYQLFYELLVDAVKNAFTKAHAFEEEKKRAEALAEIDKAKTAFFSNISHEFRTPLTLMIGPLEDALSDSEHKFHTSQTERLQLVYRNTLRLQRLVNSLLDFSRIEAGRLKANFQPTDLAKLTGDLSSVFRAAMEKAGLTYTLDMQPLSRQVYVDHEMWEKIVFNLLSNALKFTFSGGISVVLKEKDGMALLSVSDTGEGIANEELQHLFKRFYRIEGTRSRTHEGSGIGLAFVQELVKLHNGNIHVESKKGKGTTFIVSIPFGAGRVTDNNTNAVTAPAQHNANIFLEESLGWLSTFENKSHNSEDTARPATVVYKEILVVDDNADMRNYVLRILDSHPEWRITTAADGVEAMKKAVILKPDLVLSDVMMPNMDGFQLLKKLKNDPNFSSVPVVLLSARAGEESTLEGLEKGADDYLTKPFSARELVARVKTQLEITTSRQDIQALREAEERARLGVESAEQGTFELDLKSDQLIVSERMATIFGLPENASHNDYINALDIEDLAGRKKAFLRAYETGTLEYEGRIRQKQGKLKWIRIRGRIFYDHDHKASRIFGIAQDITGDKEMESQKDDFISIASHELKTPVTSLKATLQLLDRMKDNPTNGFSALITQANKSIDKVTMLIADLLNFSKVSQGLIDLNISRFKVSKLVDECCSHIRAQGTFSIHTIGDHNVEVTADAERIEQVLVNLVNNATKYAPGTKDIFINIEKSEKFVKISVKDLGPGIPADKLEHLFERYYRADRSNKLYSGLGLGLYISNEIIKKHGGEIGVSSVLGEGSTFWFTLPLADRLGN